MGSLIPETTQKLFNPETLHSAAKQSELCLVVPVRLRIPPRPWKSTGQSKRWKIKSAYGDIGLKYRDRR